MQLTKLSAMVALQCGHQTIYVIQTCTCTWYSEKLKKIECSNTPLRIDKQYNVMYLDTRQNCRLKDITKERMNEALCNVEGRGSNRV